MLSSACGPLHSGRPATSSKCFWASCSAASSRRCTERSHSASSGPTRQLMCDSVTSGPLAAAGRILGGPSRWRTVGARIAPPPLMLVGYPSSHPNASRYAESVASHAGSPTPWRSANLESKWDTKTAAPKSRTCSRGRSRRISSSCAGTSQATQQSRPTKSGRPSSLNEKRPELSVLDERHLHLESFPDFGDGRHWLRVPMTSRQVLTRFSTSVRTTRSATAIRPPTPTSRPTMPSALTLDGVQMVATSHRWL